MLKKYALTADWHPIKVSVWLMDLSSCEHNLRYIPAEPAGAIDDITKCFWCDGRMVRLKDEAICSECGWVHKFLQGRR